MNESINSKQGKYLTFALGSEEYGLEILKVREIIGYMSITSVPRTPSYVKGVINLRGQVIPVINLRIKFGIPETDITDQSCIIVVEIQSAVGKLQTGMIVDSVSEVLEIKSADLEEPPNLGGGIDDSSILAMAKIGNKVKILLDIEKVICPEELRQFSM
jgi:purine-binding chemotaxis protein CheW